MDRRLIEQVKAYDKGLEVIQTLKPVSYKPKNGQKENIGFISQDIQEPILTNQNNNGIMTVDYDKLIIMLVNSIKELSHEIELLKNKKRK
jgi:hypothetical protein